MIERFLWAPGIYPAQTKTPAQVSELENRFHSHSESAWAEDGRGSFILSEEDPTSETRTGSRQRVCHPAGSGTICGKALNIHSSI